MVFLNHASRHLTAKIIYYGPGLCGKTTNLRVIYEQTSPPARGEMESTFTETNETLYFDLLPMEVGVIGGFQAKLQLCTVPGQVFYNATRKRALKGADGIVFVADSQAAMLDANRESLQNLEENFRELGLNLEQIPMVFQWNKRDLRQVLPVKVLEKELNPRQLAGYPAIAQDGEGVFETLRGIARLVLAQIKSQHLGDGTGSLDPHFPRGASAVRGGGTRPIQPELQEVAGPGSDASLRVMKPLVVKLLTPFQETRAGTAEDLQDTGRS